MPQEPPVGSPLLGRENVIITPHTSFYSEESLLELQRKAAEEVVAVLTGTAAAQPGQSGSSTKFKVRKSQGSK